MEIKTITKDDPKRWCLIKLETLGPESLITFGNLGENTELQSSQPIVTSYLTEQELEEMVNEVAGNENYYQEAVETENEKFMLPSELYVYGSRIQKNTLEEELSEEEQIKLIEKEIENTWD